MEKTNNLMVEGFAARSCAVTSTYKLQIVKELRKCTILARHIRLIVKTEK